MLPERLSQSKIKYFWIQTIIFPNESGTGMFLHNFRFSFNEQCGNSLSSLVRQIYSVHSSRLKYSGLDIHLCVLL